MLDFPRLHNLFDRLASYSPWQILVEIAIIWIAVFALLRAVQGTRTAGLLKGLLVVVISAAVVSRLAGGAEVFQRLSYLYERFLALLAIGLLIIFQPELRRALLRLGEAPFFRSTPKEIAFIADELAEACAFLSKAKFGAIIVLERQTGLAGIVEGGTVLNAQLSAALLKTVFYPGSALHDLAVVIKGRLVHSASVQLPLAEPADMRDPGLGSRHRAAVGLTKECDALVVVVSEETGRIRIAERGRLSSPIPPGDLRDALIRRFDAARKQKTRAPEPPPPLPIEQPSTLEPLNPDDPPPPDADLPRPELSR